MKLAPIFSAGLLIPGAAAGGYYLSGHFNPNLDLPIHLEDFKSDGKIHECISSLFPALTSLRSDRTPVASKSEITDGSFTGTATSEGCLIVNGNKKTKGEKWRGNFRFLWAMKKGNKGFITFNSATAPKSNEEVGKISWEGISYLVQRDGEDRPGNLKKKKEVATLKEMNEEDFKNKFPFQGQSIKGFSQNSAFGFVNPEEDAVNMCGTEGCENPKETSFRGYWTWEHDTTGTESHKWSKNLSEWWQSLYTTAEGNMIKASAEILGRWKERFFEGLDKVHIRTRERS